MKKLLFVILIMVAVLQFVVAGEDDDPTHELRAHVRNTLWEWDGGEGETILFQENGYIEHEGWTKRGLITRWEVIDKRTILLRIERGRKGDLYAVLTFKGDLSSFDGFNFHSGARLQVSHKIGSMGVAFAVPNASAQQYPPGMVSYWKFDEGSGTIAYDSVGANDGTIYGATPTTGKVGGALSFDAMDDYVEIARNTFDGLTSLTTEAWVNFDSLDSATDAQTIISALKSGLAHYWTIMKYDDGDLLVVCYVHDKAYKPQGEVSVNISNLVDIEEWHHIAVTKSDGGTIKIYLDGIKIMDYTDATNCGGSITSNTGNTRIGGQDPRNRYLNGTIDEVAVYNRALTQSEIWQHYQSGLNGLGYEVRVEPTDVLRTLRMKFSESEKVRKRLSRSVEEMHKKADQLEKQVELNKCLKSGDSVRDKARLAIKPLEPRKYDKGCPPVAGENLPIPSYLEEYIIRGRASGGETEFIREENCPSDAQYRTVHCDTMGSVRSRHNSCPCTYPVQGEGEQPGHFTDTDGNIWIPIWGTWREKWANGIAYFDENFKVIIEGGGGSPHSWTEIDYCIVVSDEFSQ